MFYVKYTEYLTLNTLLWKWTKICIDFTYQNAEEMNNRETNMKQYKMGFEEVKYLETYEN